MDVKNSILKKNSFFLIITLLVIGIWFFWPKKALNIKFLQKVNIGADHFVIYAVDHKNKEVKIDKQEDYDKWFERKKNEKYFFGLLSKLPPVVENESVVSLPPLNLSFKSAKSDAEKIKIMYAFWTIPAGTNCEYISGKEYLHKIQKHLTINNKSTIEKIELSPGVKEPQKLFNNVSNDSSSSVELILSPQSSSSESEKVTVTIETYITNSSLPIQWPSRLDWSLFGYLWNVLIISISFLLYFFSTFLINIGGGAFFGNLGLGVVLTTIIIRTLTWPIYTKTSTFSMNMNLLQPEIAKVKQKYALQKDPASIQKMQLEILKVYRKNNFSFWGFLVSFLQLPLFIAINQTLRRFLIQGGIFETSALIHQPFLGFISLDPDQPNDISIVILLSFLVGITMFILNKISFKKPDYLKTSTHHLTAEQKMKAKQSEKTMKITSWIMILMMVFFSRSNTVLSLYWIVGNTYTIFQTLITRKKLEKKYWELKNKSI